MRTPLAPLVCLGLLLSPVAATAQTDAQQDAQQDRDRGYLTALIEDNLSDVTRQVVIEGFAGALSSRATIDVLTIADAEGVWLRAEDLVLDWNRAALLGGRIEVDTLGAASIAILRAPLSDPAPPAPEATPFSLPELPVSVNVGALSVGRIVLGEPLLGQEIVVSLDGAVSLQGGEGTARISADRIGGDGRFVIDGSYSNATQVLGLQMDLREGPDGIVARLLDLPDRPAVALKLDGTGPLNDYDAALTVATAGQDRIEGRFGLVTTQGADGGAPNHEFRLDVAGDVTPLMPPDYAEFFGSDTRLAAQGARDAQGTLRLSSLDIATGSLHLAGAAEIAADGWPRQFRLDGRLAATDGGPVLLPLAGARTFVQDASLALGFDATEGDAWTAEITATDVSRPELNIAALSLAGGGTLVPDGDGRTGQFTAALDYAAEGLRMTDAAMALAVGDTVAGDISVIRRAGGPLLIERFTLSGPGIAAVASGTVQGPEDGLLTEARVTLDAADLARFGPLAGLDGLAGAARLDLDARVRPLDGAFDIAVAGTTTDITLGIAPLDPLLTGAGSLDLAASRDESGTRIDRLDIATPAVTVTAEATLTSGASRAAFDLQITDIGLSLPGLDGAATVTGTASRDTDGSGVLVAEVALPNGRMNVAAALATTDAGGQITANVTAAIADLAPFSVLADRPLAGAAGLDLSGSIAPDAGRFDVTFAARADDLATGLPRIDPLLAGTLRLAGRLRRTGADSYVFEGLSLDGPLVTAGGRATYDLGRVETAGLNVSVTDLAPFAGLAGRPLDGALSATLTGFALRDGSLFDLTLSARSTDLATGIDRLDPLLVGDGRLDGRVARTGPLSGRAEGLALSTPLLGATLSGTLTEGVGDGAFDLRVTDAGQIAPGLAGGVRVAGTAARDADGQITVDAAATGPGGADAAFTATATEVADMPGVMSIQTAVDLALDDLSAYAALAGRRLGGAVSATVEGSLRSDLARFDLRLDGRATSPALGLPPFATLLRGPGTFGARVSRAAPGQLKVEDLAVDFANFDVTGGLRANGNTGTADFDARVADVGILTPELGGPATARGTATLGSGGDWSVDVAATGPGGIGGDVTGQIGSNGRLDLSVTGTAPLGLANSFIEPRRLDGVVRFDLAANGPPALSSLSGTLSVADARLSAPTLGRALDGLGGTVTLDGTRAQVALAATLDSGGGLRLDGSVGLAAPFTADLVLRGDGLVLRDPTLYQTTADAALTVTGPLAGGALIAGDITLGRTEVQVPTSGVGALGDLPPVTHLNTPADVRATLARAGLDLNGADVAAGNGRGRPYPLDLTIRAPARIFVRGRGLDAELGGELRIGGTTAQVVPAGEFDLVRGRLDILQQRFALTEGSAVLQGDFVPVLRLVAETETDGGLLVRIVLQGPANAPEVRFESSPVLPQDEVLSQLLFGRDLSAITPLQAVQLAAAVGSLAGTGGGGLVDGFRTGVGLDDLDITADADGNAAVRAGAYLGENIYTDITVSSGQTEINLNLDLTRNITVKGSATSDGETSLGVFFERDY